MSVYVISVLSCYLAPIGHTQRDLFIRLRYLKSISSTQFDTKLPPILPYFLMKIGLAAMTGFVKTIHNSIVLTRFNETDSIYLFTIFVSGNLINGRYPTSPARV